MTVWGNRKVPSTVSSWNDHWPYTGKSDSVPPKELSQKYKDLFSLWTKERQKRGPLSSSEDPEAPRTDGSRVVPVRAPARQQGLARALPGRVGGTTVRWPQCVLLDTVTSAGGPIRSHLLCWDWCQRWTPIPARHERQLEDRFVRGPSWLEKKRSTDDDRTWVRTKFGVYTVNEDLS